MTNTEYLTMNLGESTLGLDYDEEYTEESRS